jgi:allantoin racemase
MKLLLLNPNSTDQMTSLIADTARAAGAADVQVVNPKDGPAAIETSEDEAEAIVHLQDLLAAEPSLIENADVVIIACYGDPGLEQIANFVPVPVFGIAQLSLGVASSLSGEIGMVVAKPSAVQIMETLADSYGHPLPTDRIEASGNSVLDMVRDPEGTYPRILDAVQRLKAGGSQVVCLGCASMGQFAPRLRADTGLTVIDAVLTSVSVMLNARRNTAGADVIGPGRAKHVR